MLKGRFLFTAGIVGMLSGMASRADVDYDREWNPYVTLRGGWLFGGNVKYNAWSEPCGGVGRTDFGSAKKTMKSAWSGSGEFGVSFCEDRVSVGLELGYFTGKTETEHDVPLPAMGHIIIDNAGWVPEKLCYRGKIENYFCACNVMLRRDVGERAFLYGGVGAGIARSTLKHPGYLKGHGIGGGHGAPELYFNKKSEWRFLCQAFAGIGMYLNDNWSLSAGYRLRYVPWKFNSSWTKEPAYAQSAEIKSTIKQNILHAAEIGLTYQF